MYDVTKPDPTQTQPPKAFLSYRWTSREYIDRVEDLARNLVADGVQVVFDQWDITEGQDLHTYMEQAVNDPTVTRVLLLCDPGYSEKADKREGGVGKETLIISGEVYAQAQQTKFVPVVMERDGNGEICLPAYLKGRYHIDLSDPASEGEQYVRLLRNLYNKPERPRPALGKAPAFLDDSMPSLRTGRALRTFEEALQRERLHAPGLLEDYLDRLADAYSDEVIAEPAETLDALFDQQAESIKRFLPYRDEFGDLMFFLGRYGERLELYDRLHAFFETLVSKRLAHKSVRYRDELVTENLAFLCWELWLYAVGGLLRAGRGEAVARLFSPFCCYSPDFGGGLLPFHTIDTGFEFLANHNPIARSGQGRHLSYAAKLLKDRATHPKLPFEALIEADVLSWFRAATDLGGYWYPRTLIFWGAFADPLPMFARAETPTVFKRLAPALGVRDRTEMEQQYDRISADQFGRIGRFPGGKWFAQALGLRSRAPRPA